MKSLKVATSHHPKLKGRKGEPNTPSKKRDMKESEGIKGLNRVEEVESDVSAKIRKILAREAKKNKKVVSSKEEDKEEEGEEEEEEDALKDSFTKESIVKEATKDKGTRSGEGKSGGEAGEEGEEGGEDREGVKVLAIDAEGGGDKAEAATSPKFWWDDDKGIFSFSYNNDASMIPQMPILEIPSRMIVPLFVDAD